MARRVRVRGSRRQVWNGSRQKTMSGLSKSDFTTNKNGKLVSKKQHAHGKRAYKNIRGWTQAVSKARKALGITGFCAVKKGTALYKKAREFYCVCATGARSTTKCSTPELTHVVIRYPDCRDRRCAHQVLLNTDHLSLLCESLKHSTIQPPSL